MNSYYIPRNYKGEGRLLYIFSTKAIIYTAAGLLAGLILYFILKLLGFTIAGIIIAVIFGCIGFVIGTFKIPEIKNFEITKKTGGENIDDVIKRWIKFKKSGRKIYVYMKEKEETKDE